MKNRSSRLLSLVLALGFAVSPITKVQAQGTYSGATCEELWFQRNLIFAKNGYCFKSPEARSVFGDGCFAPFGRLSRDDELEVNQLISLESLNRCDAKGRNWGTSVFRPIIVGRDPELDACNGTGVIIGLDPRRDGFLSVRTGPKGKENDRVFNGQSVHVCDQSGDWIGIVYAAPGEDPMTCNVATSLPRPLPYTGPCRYGWVHKDYVRQISG